MSMELIELSNALVKGTDHTAASVVAVHTEARRSSSGVIWRPGVIVTAEHALRRDEEIQATLPNGRIVPATLAGRDPSTDLAKAMDGQGLRLLRIEFLRGNYSRVRRVTVQLRVSNNGKDRIAA